ncbi:MAG TPA: LLM class flavin-dependent oxidoreductase [Candidatus Binataceae bacterium]|nr:LLM class flavin-dependent oxidoreductase [Candidatus Binataceae bacterium]
MERIEFGVAIPAMKDIAGFARKAEALGYDYLSVGEHVMFHTPVSNSLISLSVAAGATSTIKLVSSIVLLPLYNPVMAAKLTSVLDFASNGRYHLGIGVGGEFPREFEACGIPVKQRGSRTNEALEVIKRLWTEKDVTFEGRYTKFRNVTLSPHPIQKPHPPIWVAGRKEPAMLRAARYANGWMPYMYTPEMVRDSIEKITKMRSDAGRDKEPFSNGLFIFASIDSDRERALAQAAQTLGRSYAQDFSKIAERYTLSGTPADFRKRIKEYIDAGVRTIFMPWACRSEDVERNATIIAEEVVPEFK